MRGRRHTLATAGVAGVAALYLVAAFLLYRGFAAYGRAERRLRASKEELSRLYDQDPFPSEPNVAIEKQNLAELERELAALQATLGARQIEAVEQSPSRFMAQFWDTRKELLDRAKTAGVSVPEGFAFGFGRHMPGNLPATPDVPRLTQQLRLVQALCETLYQARISELRGIGREEFETGVGGAEEGSAPAGRARERRRPDATAALANVPNPQAGLIPDRELFGRWHFVLHFTAKEAALRDVLNRLARGSLVIVVTRLELAGEEFKPVQGTSRVPAAAPKSAGRDAGRSAERPAASEPAAEETPQILPRDLRLACGREGPMLVKLELDVYQFRHAPATAGGPAKD